jgi:AAA domain
MGNAEGEVDKVALAERPHLYITKSADSSRGDASAFDPPPGSEIQTSRDCAAELRAALAAVKAAPRGQRDMRRLAVAYEALDEYVIPLHAYEPALAAAFAAATNPSKEFKRQANSNGKTPIGDAWQIQDDRPAYARFTDPRTGGSLQCNIGKLNGARKRNGNRALLLDIDTKATGGAEKATRAERIRHLEAKAGVKVPDTPMTLSATRPDLAPEVGGLIHMEVSADIDVKFSGPIAGVDCPQQAAMPGSEIDGRFYDMAPGRGFGEVAAAMAPPTMYKRKSDADSAVDKATGKAKIAEGANIDSAANRARYLDWLDKYAPEAVENENKHKTAIGILQRGKDEGLSAIVAATVAHDSEWNRTRCHPSYELDRLIQMSETSDPSRQNEIGSRSPDVVFGDLSPEQIEEMKKAEADRKAEQDAARKEAEDPDLSKYGIGHGRAIRVEPPRYLIKNWLNLGATSSWFGPPKSGKSATLVNCAVHLAAGRDWVGCKTKQALVVYLAYERGEETEERYLAACEKLGLSQDLPFVVVKRPPLLKTTNGAEILIGVIEKLKKLHGQERVFIASDTLTAAAPGEDLDGSTGMSAVLNRLQHVRDHFGAHLAIVHHTPKSDPHTARGSGALLGHVDLEVNVFDKKVRMTNRNRGALAQPLPFIFEGVKMGVDEDGEDYEVLFTDVRPANVDVEGPAADVPERAPAAEAFGDKRRSKEAVLEDEIITSIIDFAGAKRKPTVKTVLADLMRHNKLDVDDAGAMKESARRLYDRARNSLREAGRIYQDGDELGLKQ